MLRTLDEMERKIQLDALALSVGLAMLTFSASSILQTADILPQLKAYVLLTIMAFSYSIGLVLGWLRLAWTTNSKRYERHGNGLKKI